MTCYAYSLSWLDMDRSVHLSRCRLYISFEIRKVMLLMARGKILFSRSEVKLKGYNQLA